jgi:hypothetical protein
MPILKKSNMWRNIFDGVLEDNLQIVFIISRKPKGKNFNLQL